jgi:hypothetical protein
MFLPFEQRWIFQLAFRHMIPSLLGQKNIRKVQQVNTDGGRSNQFSFGHFEESAQYPFERMSPLFMHL